MSDCIGTDCKRAGLQSMLAEKQAEIERLQAEAADFHMAYRMKCDEMTKTQAAEIERLRVVLDEQRDSADFYRRRCAALGDAQARMRDPERRMVCDVLANGFLLRPEGDRYSVTDDEALLRQALDALEFFRDTAICAADTSVSTEVIVVLRERLTKEPK